MSLLPDPSELAPSRDPAVYGRRRLFSARLAVWLAACAGCLLVGAVAGRYGLRLAPSPPPAPQISTRPAPPPTTATAPQPSAPVAAAVLDGGATLGALGARLARLEQDAARTDRAAALALAAASLSEASEGSGPFAGELGAYERLAPDDPNLRALEPLASRGAPSRAALAAALPALASEAAASAHAARQGDSAVSRFLAMLGRVVVVRRIDVGAPGVDGALARAEAAASAGDLEAAVGQVRPLPPAARAPLVDWIAAADRRIAIDHDLEALRAQALANLGQPTTVAS